jgi:23S rRNA (adenine2503-C2)-methyltransferase
MKLLNVLKSSNENVKKYVYGDDDKLVETVIYKYPDYKTRATICISCQSGCRVGCVFCGTGKHFICNLTTEEIIFQVISTFSAEGYDEIVSSKKLQIMFMSMGEPSHNWKNLKIAITELHKLFPTSDLLVSTIGTNNDDFLSDFLTVSKQIPQIGLQFSIHHFDNEKRNLLIPFNEKLSLEQISAYGTVWNAITGRKPFCNYVVTKSNNKGYERLFTLFPPEVFCFTFSVLCSPTETIKSAFLNNKDDIKIIHDDFLNHGYNVRIFDPAGQDDIGGGCGQLWYFQDFIKKQVSKPIPWRWE